MKPASTIRLEFDPSLNTIPGKDKKLTDGLSAVVEIGGALWVANDETLTLERLALDPSGAAAGSHAQFFLGESLELPAPPEKPGDFDEADLEGLAWDGDYPWLVGSHSLKRKQPKPGSSFAQASKRLLDEEVKADGNRYLLARIPLDANGAPAKKVQRGGETLAAARLPGGRRSDALTEALQKDEHLARFLEIPGKDNGFDIEGLAAAGGRLFVGLRGPVLRGCAVVLEVAPEEGGEPGRLGLAGMGPGGRAYRKHFLQLGGLGVRDLCVDGPDLLVLAGPTMDLDGPVAVFRWPGGANPAGESFVEAGRLEKLLDVPFGAGGDHAEGMDLFAGEDGSRRLLVVYDSAAASRRPKENAARADVFILPAAGGMATA